MIPLVPAMFRPRRICEGPINPRGHEQTGVQSCHVQPLLCEKQDVLNAVQGAAAAGGEADRATCHQHRHPHVLRPSKQPEGSQEANAVTLIINVYAKSNLTSSFLSLRLCTKFHF